MACDIGEEISFCCVTHDIFRLLQRSTYVDQYTEDTDIVDVISGEISGWRTVRLKKLLSISISKSYIYC